MFFRLQKRGSDWGALRPKCSADSVNGRSSQRISAAAHLIISVADLTDAIQSEGNILAPSRNITLFSTFVQPACMFNVTIGHAF